MERKGVEKRCDLNVLDCDGGPMRGVVIWFGDGDSEAGSLYVPEGRLEEVYDALGLRVARKIGEEVSN